LDTLHEDLLKDKQAQASKPVFEPALRRFSKSHAIRHDLATGANEAPTTRFTARQTLNSRGIRCFFTIRKNESGFAATRHNKPVEETAGTAEKRQVAPPFRRRLLP